MGEEARTSCPDDLPKLEFNVAVEAPDPDAEHIRDRKNGRVVARYEGEPVGELLFGFLGEDIAITRMETADAYRCRGCARQMIDALIAYYPERKVKDGGNWNSVVGDLVLTRWREKGILSDG